MQVIFNIEKRHLYILALFLIIVSMSLSAFLGTASHELKKDPGHDFTELSNVHVDTVHLEDSAVTPGKVSFSYAGSSSKGGAATDLGCSDCVALGSETTGAYAAGTGEAGSATGVACSDCVTLGSETVGSYAAGTSEGGAATDVSCSDCVALGSETVGSYAAGTSEGGAATDVSCSRCVGTSDVAGEGSLCGFCSSNCGVAIPTITCRGSSPCSSCPSGFSSYTFTVGGCIVSTCTWS